MSYICLNCKDKVEEHFKITKIENMRSAKCQVCGGNRKSDLYKIEKKEINREA